MEAALAPTDAVITSYRDHCTHLGRGGTMNEVRAARALNAGGGGV